MTRGALLIGAGLLVGPMALGERTELPEPTRRDVKYGPHERNVLDYWQGEGDAPHPLLVIIHGGGWLGGDKAGFVKQYAWLIPELLGKGVSVAAINYRLSPQAPLPAPVHDAARAIQYLRYHADEYGLDKRRIACTGNSAGATTSLWLATHDDMADPEAEDPVLRESTRLVGAWVSSPQTSIDPMVIRDWPNASALKHPMIHRAAGFKNNAEMFEKYEEARELYREFSPINHLSKDDPPLYLRCGGYPKDTRDGIHHITFGIKFKEKADELGAVCHLSTRADVKLYPKPSSPTDYLLEVLEVTPPAKQAVPEPLP